MIKRLSASQKQKRALKDKNFRIQVNGKLYDSNDDENNYRSSV
jgi:hypothetical protein